MHENYNIFLRYNFYSPPPLFFLGMQKMNWYM